MKRLYVAATRQNDGKTIVSLGLMRAFAKRYEKVGYMKPVGQQYVVVKGEKVDKDTVLMQKIFGLEDKLSNMSPIAIPKGFTENYILGGTSRKELAKQIKDSYKAVAKNKDFVLIEGTGHAGVGSVFDMSNSDVAKLLDTEVILVSLGGIGKPIDEILLNKAKFDAMGIKVLGAIVNKVHRKKYDKINTLVRRGLARQGIDVLGAIPYDNVLSNPSVAELLEDLDGELISGEEWLDNIVAKFVIGDMIPHEALDAFTSDSLLIVPGNREELILAALSGCVLEASKLYGLSAIIFTYGLRPHRKILSLIKKTHIPVIMVQEDSFTTATRINNMIFKVRAEDKEKIYETESLIEKYVDIDRLDGLIKKRRK